MELSLSVRSGPPPARLLIQESAADLEAKLLDMEDGCQLLAEKGRPCHDSGFPLLSEKQVSTHLSMRAAASLCISS